MTSLKQRIETLEKRLRAIKYPTTTYTFTWQGPAAPHASRAGPADDGFSLSRHDVSTFLGMMTEAGYLAPDLPPWEPEDRSYTHDEFDAIVNERRQMTLADDPSPETDDDPADDDHDEDPAWADLTEEDQALWARLGWDEATWDDGSVSLPYEQVAWDELSLDQRDALWDLGYDRASWNASLPGKEDAA